MQFDPISLNFLHGTGGYVWQLAEFMATDHSRTASRTVFSGSAPPVLADALRPYPERFGPGAKVRWRDGVAVRQEMPSLIGPRGFSGVLVVAPEAQSFGTFDPLTFEVLAEGVDAATLLEITLNGKIFAADTLLVALVRHGLVACDFADEPTVPSGFLVEPTTALLDTRDFGWVGINQLNGRTLVLNEHSLALLEKMPSSGRRYEGEAEDTNLFVKAGLLRRLSGRSTQ